MYIRLMERKRRADWPAADFESADRHTVWEGHGFKPCRKTIPMNCHSEVALAPRGICFCLFIPDKPRFPRLQAFPNDKMRRIRQLRLKVALFQSRIKYGW